MKHLTLATTLATILLVACFAMAQETILNNFQGYPKDGADPSYGSLTFDQAGNLYGVTWAGGTNLNHNNGTVFEMVNTNGTWTEKLIFDLCHNQGSKCETDGSHPQSTLLIDGQGDLYGTAPTGGDSGIYGTVFKLSQVDGVWKMNILLHFNGKDGKGPESLTFDGNGNLYGTMAGGKDDCGMVFELSPAKSYPWTEKILYKFACGKDGYQPSPGLVFDAAGNLYGTTARGGAYKCLQFPSCGTAFELSPTATGYWTKTIIHSFGQTGDGAGPLAGMTFDSHGNLYGTTYEGGSCSGNSGNGCGVVFELVAGSWQEKVLYSFSSLSSLDGNMPEAPVTLDAQGNIYGTTFEGGTYGTGTVFELANGVETVLYNFQANSSDGVWPMSGVVLDQSGNIYGTASSGGQFGYGTVYEIGAERK